MKDFPEFEYDAGSWRVTQAMTETYDKQGFIVVRQMFSSEEIQKIRTAVESPEFQKYKYMTQDGYDRLNKFILWNHPGNDVTGLLARPQKIAGTMEKLMDGDEVYHYHTKLNMKDAYTGGTFVWHQDYGYWYKNGCLFPEMGSVFIPIDDTDRENGCLQVLAGSHRLGRVDHINTGEHFGADLERVEQAKTVHAHIYATMGAGDALFFHCNLLHTSDQNHSPRRRWAFIATFNKRSNDPYKDHHHARYTPLSKVEDSALLACNNVRDMEGKWFMKYEEDTTSPRSIH